jgi:hypothetical protein
MMASDRRQRANQSNASRSTGPRTQKGKTTTSLNAFRHGLATPVWADPEQNEEIKHLAHAIAGEQATPATLDAAFRIAEADVDLRRIWRTRLKLEGAPSDPGHYKKKVSPFAELYVSTTLRRDLSEQQKIELLHEAGVNRNNWLFIKVPSDGRKQNLAALERYERRALSRRKSAIRDFDAARR